MSRFISPLQGSPNYQNPEFKIFTFRTELGWNDTERESETSTDPDFDFQESVKNLKAAKVRLGKIWEPTTLVLVNDLEQEVDRREIA